MKCVCYLSISVIKVNIFLQNGYSNFPCVFKVGHAHAGMGKVKVENEKGFQVRRIYLPTLFLDTLIY